MGRRAGTACAAYRGTVLHGREKERTRLADVWDRTRAGEATSVLLRGDAGVGKSVLLDDLAELAGDARVLRTVGLRAETALAFAGLHRLLHPVLDLVPHLPGPQQRALRRAFGEVDGDRLDPFLVSLATLTLVTELAEQGPVLCLVDDLQWLDASSADVVLFVARRLLADPVAFVLAARDEPGFEPPLDVPELVVGGISPDAVRSILRERTGQEPSERLVEVVTSRTGGNPLAVVELPAHLSPAHLDGTAVLPPDLPLSARVERAFLERCRQLSPDGQTLLLLAAADDAVPISVLQSAAERLGVPATAWTGAESAGLLLAEGEVVRVQHPLVRSAVYQAATALERRTAHAALADALLLARDADRHAWHRGLAALAPDEDVARLLEEVAGRAERRGGHEAASSAYERSARLSAQDESTAMRLLAAARNAYTAGRLDNAGSLLRESRAVADDALLRADIDRLRCRIEVAVGSALDAHRIFVAAARTVAVADPARALEMAAMAAVLQVHAADSGSRLPPGLVPVETAPTDSVRVQCLKRILAGSDLDSAGDWGAALGELRAALPVVMTIEDRDVWANLANLALHLGEATAHRTLFTAMLSAARADGSVMEVLYALNRLCLSQFATGQWSAALRSVEESESLARSVGQPAQTAIPVAVRALVAAHVGDDDLESLLEVGTATLQRHRLGVMDGPVSDLLRWARGVRAAGAGDATDALHHLRQMQVPVLCRLAAIQRIGAAVAAGDAVRAREWTDEVSAYAQATGSTWARAVSAHGLALLSDDPEPLFERALAAYDEGDRPYGQAWASLALGEHLRRSGRRVDARRHLRGALEGFHDLGAEPLADRAARELRASGETARRRNPATLTDLTPTEMSIARLVSRGMSNKEVAEQCWVSPRTVAFHLRNVFAKTGLTSRAQLSQLDLDTQDAP